MYLFIFRLSLVLEIFLYNILICILPNCIDIISTCPKFTAPKRFFYLWMKPEYFLRPNALDRANYLFRSIRRNTLNQKMNVVTIKTNLQKMNVVPFLYSKTNLLERSRNRFIMNVSPIFDGANKMIEQQTLVMTLVNMFTHNHKNTYQYATPRQNFEEF